MSLIGITGGIVSGKTFISRMFNSSEAFVVFNSDLCAKQILVENSEVIDFVKNKIGEKSYKDGIIQTKYISDVIFNDKRKLNELNTTKASLELNILEINVFPEPIPPVIPIKDMKKRV